MLITFAIQDSRWVRASVCHEVRSPDQRTALLPREISRSAQIAWASPQSNSSSTPTVQLPASCYQHDDADDDQVDHALA